MLKNVVMAVSKESAKQMALGAATTVALGATGYLINKVRKGNESVNVQEEVVVEKTVEKEIPKQEKKEETPKQNDKKKEEAPKQNVKKKEAPKHNVNKKEEAPKKEKKEVVMTEDEKFLQNVISEIMAATGGAPVPQSTIDIAVKIAKEEKMKQDVKKKEEAPKQDVKKKEEAPKQDVKKKEESPKQDVEKEEAPEAKRVLVKSDTETPEIEMNDVNKSSLMMDGVEISSMTLSRDKEEDNRTLNQVIKMLNKRDLQIVLGHLTDADYTKIELTKKQLRKEVTKKIADKEELERLLKRNK